MSEIVRSAEMALIKRMGEGLIARAERTQREVTASLRINTVDVDDLTRSYNLAVLIFGGLMYARPEQQTAIMRVRAVAMGMRCGQLPGALGADVAETISVEFARGVEKVAQVFDAEGSA